MRFGMPGRTESGAPRALIALAGGLNALAAAAGAQAQAPASQIETERDRVTHRYSTTSHRGYPAINAAELLGVFLTDASLSGPGMQGRVEGRLLELRAESPWLRYDGELYQLANVPYAIDGAFWVPAELVTNWWGAMAPPGVAAPPPVTSRAERPDGPWRVIIDPGHGGKDPGSLGASGTREKDVVLAISLELYERLKAVPGVEPVLTRDRDMFVPVRARSTFAVQEEGDLFISIHANAFGNRAARGFETFFLAPAKTEAAREVAMRENSAVQYEEDQQSYEAMSELDFILAGLEQNENIIESRRVAGYTQNALRAVKTTPDRGVKQAGLWVLVGASGTMPTMLVEVGFVSNRNEEASLRSAVEQKRIAGALAEGLLKYRNYIERQYEAGETGGTRE